MADDLRRVFAMLGVAPFLLLAACGGSSGEGDGGEGSGTQACSAELTPAADAAAKPPADFPTTSGAVFYDTEKQGETTYYFAYVDGDEVVPVRDDLKDDFAAANFEIEGDDAEDNVEAEFEFAGAHRGSIQVIHQCEGKLRIRYRVES